MGVYTSIPELCLEDQREIIEGVCAVVAACPGEHVGPLLHRIMEPVVQALNDSLNENSNDQALSMKNTAMNLDRLAHIFKSLHIDMVIQPHPLNAAVSALWPLLQRTASVFQTEESLMEKLCRLWKSEIRSCGHNFPVLVPLCQLLTELYNTVQYSCFLYCANVALDEVSRGPQMSQNAALFSHMLDVFSSATFRRLRDANAYVLPTISFSISHYYGLLHANFLCFGSVRDYPDIAEDFFHLLKRYVQILPGVILQSPVLAASFQCASHGVRVSHREASEAVFTYLLTLIESAISNPTTASAVDAILRQHGQVRLPSSKPTYARL